MATDEQTETLEQTVRLEAIGAAMRFEGPDEESQEERWRLAVRPLVEIIADLRSAATRANEAGNREIEKLNREIYCLRADLTATRNAGAGYADALTISQDENKALRAEVERLRGLLADANETIKGADESRKGYVAEIQRLKLYVDALKSDLGVVRDSLTAAEREADRHQNRTQRLQHAVKALAAMVVDADRTRGQS